MEFHLWHIPIGIISSGITYILLCWEPVGPNQNAAGYLRDKPKWLWGPGWHLGIWPFTKTWRFPSAMDTVKVTIHVLPAEAQNGLRFGPDGGIKRWTDLSPLEQATVLANPLEYRHPIEVDLDMWYEIPLEGIFNFIRHMNGDLNRAKSELQDAGRAVGREVLALFTIDTMLSHGSYVTEKILEFLVAPQLGLPTSRLSSIPPSWGLLVPKIRMGDLRPDTRVAASQVDFVAAISEKKTTFLNAEASMKQLELLAELMKSSKEGAQVVVLDQGAKILGGTDKMFITGGLASPLASLASFTEVLNELGGKK